ncbi:MAG: phage replisome organizer N-terminal domain-containing protein, partial [Chthoniobacterales bacterium]
MSEVKWLKVSVGMFDDEKIRLIDALPDSDGILVVWIKLLSLAAKVNAGGEIYLNEDMAYTEPMLATIFHRKLTLVSLALSTFVKFGMVQITESNRIVIKNWAKHQNIEGLDKIRESSRERQQKFRDRSKNGTPLLKDSTANVTETLLVTLASRDVTQQSKKERRFPLPSP